MRWLLILLTITSALFAQETHLSSDEADYDGKALLLRGHVHVEHEMGIVDADEASLIRDLEKEHAMDFPWIRLKGHIQLQLESGSTLFCDHVELDLPEQKGHLVGTPELSFEDPRGTIRAHEAFVEYAEIDHELRPIRITLLSEVLISRKDRKQMALADKAIYFPETESLILEGSPVLFFDESKGLELSAESVVARKDPVTGEEMVEGRGEVRFTLQSDEVAELRKRFE